LTNSADDQFINIDRIGAPSSVPWPILHRVLATVFCLIVLGGGLMVWLGFAGLQQRLLPQIHLKAETVGRSLSNQLSRALDDGVPVDKIIGLHEFLGAALEDNPEVSYIVLTNSSGALLWSEARGGEDLVKQLSFPKIKQAPQANKDGEDQGAGTSASAGTLGSAVTEEIGRFYDTALPVLTRDDGVQGILHVGVHQDYILGLLSGVLSDLGLLLVATMGVAAYFLYMYLQIRMDHPLAAVRKGMFIASLRDFRFRVQTAAVDDVFEVSRNFNQVTRRLGEAYTRMVEEAEEAKAAQIDPIITERIDQAVLRFARHFRAVGPDERRIITDDVTLRGEIPLFQLLVAVTLVLPFFPTGLAEAYVISAFAAGAAVAVAGLLLFHRRSLCRLFYVPGVMLAAVGVVGAATVPDLFSPVIWSALAGLGMGTVGGAILLGMANESTVDRTFVPGGALLCAAFFAVTLRSVTGEGISAEAANWLAVLLAGCAVMFSWSTGWPNPVSVVGLQLGLRPRAEDAEGGKLRSVGFGTRLVSALILLSWSGGLSGILFDLIPRMDQDVGLNPFDAAHAMMVYFMLVWLGSAYVLSRGGRGLPLRLLAVLGGVCGGLGVAYFSLAGGEAEHLPRLLPSLVGGDDVGAATLVAWLGIGTLAVGHAVATVPGGMLVVAANRVRTWRPSELRSWGGLLFLSLIGLAGGPLLSETLASSLGLVQTGEMLGFTMALGACFCLLLPAYIWREGPVPIDRLLQIDGGER